MQGDGPTLSNLPAYTPGASGEPDGTPPWPSSREGRGRAFGDDRLPFGSAYPLILGISFFANVVLVLTLIGVLLATHTGFFAPGGPSPRGAASGPAQSTPTATANLTPSITSTAGWLQVTPDSIHLACDGGQRIQLVVLANTGTRRVQWQADISGSGDQAAVTVNPDQGTLRAGANVAIQIEINTSGGSGSPSQQGVIQFDPDIPDAGAPASLSYTADSCNN